MRKQLLCMTLVALLGCCGQSPTPVTPRPISPCEVPAIPAIPAIQAEECGEKVCITVLETVALARWIRLVGETQTALQGCSLVELR